MIACDGDRVKKRIITCPRCGSSDLHYEMGMMLGQIYRCKSCQYVGSFVIERDLEVEED